MKKLLVGLFAAALMALGLVGISSGSAHAKGCDPNPYTMCVRGTAKIDLIGKLDRGEKGHFNVPVDTSGNVTPRGTVKVTCIGPSGQKKIGKARVGNEVSVGPFRQKGKWTCFSRYIGADGFKGDISGEKTYTV